MASEVAPLAKTGGLADVSSALPRYLHGKGHDVRLFLPFYSSIDTKALELAPLGAVQNVPLALGTHRYRFSIVTARLPGVSLPIHLVHCPALYHRPGIYSAGADEHLRFLLLTRAAIDTCQRLGFAPQIFHCNDWHTAFAPLYLRSVYAWDRLFAGTRTVLTIHNIGYQGIFPAASVGDLGLGDAQNLLHQDELRGGRINSLRHGILYADVITTVSPTYAREICTDEYGMPTKRLPLTVKEVLFKNELLDGRGVASLRVGNGWRCAITKSRFPLPPRSPLVLRLECEKQTVVDQPVAVCCEEGLVFLPSSAVGLVLEPNQCFEELAGAKVRRWLPCVW